MGSQMRQHRALSQPTPITMLHRSLATVASMATITAALAQTALPLAAPVDFRPTPNR